MRTDRYTYIRTDSQTDVMKLVVAFHKFAKAPKNEFSEVVSVLSSLAGGGSGSEQ
jgi:hypothetical protein